MVVPDAELAGGAARVQCGCNCDDLVVCNCRDKTAGLDWSINPRATNADTTTKATGTTTTTITAAGGSGSNLLSPHRRSWSDTNLLRASGTVVPTREKMPTLLTRAPPAPTLRRRRSSHNMASPGVVGTGHVSRGPGSSSSVRNGGGSKMQKGAPWNGSHVEDFLAEGVAEREAVGFEEPPRRFGWGERVGAATAAAEGRAPGNEQPQQQEFSWRRRRRRRREGQDDGSGAISVEPLLEVRARDVIGARVGSGASARPALCILWNFREVAPFLEEALSPDYVDIAEGNGGDDGQSMLLVVLAPDSSNCKAHELSVGYGPLRTSSCGIYSRSQPWLGECLPPQGSTRKGRQFQPPPLAVPVADVASRPVCSFRARATGSRHKEGSFRLRLNRNGRRRAARRAEEKKEILHASTCAGARTHPRAQPPLIPLLFVP